MIIFLSNVCEMHLSDTSKINPQILPQDLLKKYITYAKLNVFPRLHDADLDKLSHVYAELRRESSVILYLPMTSIVSFELFC